MIRRLDSLTASLTSDRLCNFAYVFMRGQAGPARVTWRDGGSGIIQVR